MALSITAEELAKKIRKKEDLMLIDIREDWERKMCHIKGDVHIPMGDILERIKEIPKDKDIVVYCHSGNRSAQAALFLAASGRNAMSLTGGIDEWAERIERKMKRY